MNLHSEELLLHVNPILAEKVKESAFELTNQGIEMRVTDGVRTKEQQDGLYELGRIVLVNPKGEKQGIVTNARGGYSSHNFGLAVDVVPGVKGKQPWTPQYDIKTPEFKAMVASLKKQGLAWGGDWKTLKGDYVHFYLANTPANPTDKMRQDLANGGYSMVFANADKGVYA